MDRMKFAQDELLLLEVRFQRAQREPVGRDRKPAADGQRADVQELTPA